MFPVMVRAAGRRLPTALRMLSLMESRHKTLDEPHLYLAFIGTDPNSQGRGHGSALLRSMLERCDKEVFPAYLEATSPGNRAFYHRHGFELREELHWPDDGPPFWPMWRKPLG
jgi:ribosomal protein S18 acetylase RimI-like enzyme